MFNVKKLKRYLWGCLTGVSFIALYGIAVNIDLGFTELAKGAFLYFFWALVLIGSGYKSGFIEFPIVDRENTEK